MSNVKFTPGPHPTSHPEAIPEQDTAPNEAPFPASNDDGSDTVTGSKHPSDPSAPNSPITITFNRRATPSNLTSDIDASDAERQPLIPTRQLNRRRLSYPIIVAIAVFVILGVVMGFGGWRLGKGEGGGRWPGGPVAPPEREGE